MELNENKTTELTLSNLEGWRERVADLKAFVSEMGQLTPSQLVANGVRKAGHCLALASLLHCSSGYIGDKFRNKTSTEAVEVVKELIAPQLTPEQIKARDLAAAISCLKTLREQHVPEATIAVVIGNMRQGKEALAQNPAV